MIKVHMLIHTYATLLKRRQMQPKTSFFDLASQMLDYARVTRLGYVTRHPQLPIGSAQQKLLHRSKNRGLSQPSCRASINHGRNMDETWTIHGQLASSLAAQRLRHALSHKRCTARSIGVHGTLMYLNLIFRNCYYRTRILIQ